MTLIENAADSSVDYAIKRYKLNDLLPLLSKVTAMTGKIEKSTALSRSILSDPVVKHCAFIQHFRDDAATLSYQDWFAGISNLALCQDGEEKIHSWSSCYPDYSADETQLMIERAREAAKPVTCDYIRGELGFTKCLNCPVKAPIAWSSSNLGITLHTIEAYLESLNAKDKISSKSLPFAVNSALTTLYMCDASLFEEAVLSLGKHLDKQQLSSLKTHIMEQAREEQQRQDEIRTARCCDELSQMLGYKVNIPCGFPITERGIEKVSKDKRALIMPRIVLPFKRYEYPGNELIGLKYQKAHGYSSIIVPRSTLASSGKIIELASHGIPIDTSTALPTVTFFTHFLLENEENMPHLAATPSLGWQKDESFIPGLSDMRLIKTGEEFDSTDSLQPSGTLEEWTETMRPLRQYMGSRLAMAASMSAPLLYLLGVRTFIVHIWGPSRGGKTASQKAALSLWLDPSGSAGNIISFNATRVAFETTLGYLKNLPFMINERQQVGNDQNFLDQLLYMLGEGQGRSRGARSGGLRKLLTWNTVVVTSGEHPLISSASAEGERTRCLEIFAESFIGDAKLASAMHSLSERYYGTAGLAVLSEVIANKETIKQEFEMFKTMISANHPELPGAYHDYIAVLALSERLLSEIIYGHTRDQANELANELICHITNSIPSSIPEYMHAYTYLQDWVSQHMDQFDKNSIHRAGWIIGDETDVCFFPNAFNYALIDGGFNPARVRRDFANKKLLQKSVEEFTVTRKDPSTERQTRVILLKNFLTAKEKPYKC